MSLKRVGILTGGGDCSGLNAVIRAVTRSAIISYGAEVIGIEEGFEGLIFEPPQKTYCGRNQGHTAFGRNYSRDHQ